MEGISRLVSESLARHGFDRPLDYRRLHWSRWFRCESHHSLLQVPSKPGVFALAEEIVNFDSTPNSGNQAEPTNAANSHVEDSHVADTRVEDRRFSAASSAFQITTALAAAGTKAENEPRRMLAVAQFFEADDMAFSLDRMLIQANPMRARLNSGRYFVRYVTIQEDAQRRSICASLNQWVANSGEKISGIGAHFASSLELTETKTGEGGADALVRPAEQRSATPHLDSGSASNIHCPSPLPSGF